jgi:hypothetical protein
MAPVDPDRVPSVALLAPKHRECGQSHHLISPKTGLR